MHEPISAHSVKSFYMFYYYYDRVDVDTYFDATAISISIYIYIYKMRLLLPTLTYSENVFNYLFNLKLVALPSIYLFYFII